MFEFNLVAPTDCKVSSTARLGVSDPIIEFIIFPISNMELDGAVGSGPKKSPVLCVE